MCQPPPAPGLSGPRLSVRAFAEMMRLPAYEQMRILEAHKYPPLAPGEHQVPYYCEALGAVRRYYRHDNDERVVREVLRYLQSRRKPSSRARAGRNALALEAFLESSEARRSLTPVPFGPRDCAFHGLVLQLSFDVVGEEARRVKFKLYNMADEEMDEELVRSTLELSSHLLSAEEVAHRFGDLEYFDMAEDRLWRWPQVRQRTLHRARKTAQLVCTLWPTL